jgi:FkbM family methyltransferase
MPELPFLRHLIAPGCLAVDAGANIGVVASEIARHAGQVLAFEPNPMAFAVLRHLRARNVAPVWAALGAAAGEAPLVVPVTRKGPSSNGGHLADARDEGAAALTYQVPVLALDSLDLPGLGFLKIDVEGHEPEVLDGARETIRRHRPTIMVEHEVSHAGAAFGDVFQRLAELGYEGVFLLRGRLLPLAAFDAARHQGPGTRKADGSYVSNFFFLPRDQGAPGA